MFLMDLFLLFLMFQILILLYENAAIASVNRGSVVLRSSRGLLARVVTCNEFLKLLVRKHRCLISLSEDLPLR